ncbi:MAG: hypothetical protein Kow0092_06250 [Deferrisomatales bacterium]
MPDSPTPSPVWFTETLGALSACADLDSLFDTWVRRVRAVCPLTLATVSQLCEDGGALRVSRCWSQAPGPLRPGQRIPLAHTLSATAFARADAVYVPDHDAAPHLPPLARELGGAGVAASLIVPLVLGGRPRGSVGLGFSRPCPLGDDDRHLLTALARTYGAFHFWTRDIASLETARQVDRVLGQVGMGMLGPGDLREGMQQAIGVLTEQAGADWGAIVGPAPGKEAELYGWHDRAREAGREEPLAREILGLAEALPPLAEPLVWDGTGTPPDPLGSCLDRAGAGAAACLVLPLGQGGRGLLALLRREPGPWPPTTGGLLEVASRLLTLALERHLAEEERNRTEAKLRRAQTLEAVGQLAGGVAHEFNNILGGVLGCAYLLALEGESPPCREHELDRIRNLCKRGGDLTRQLLAFARRVPGKRTLLDPAELVEEVRRLLGRTIEKTVTIRAEVATGLPPLHADRSVLTTALLNLCLNARDAMPEGGEMVLRAEARADRVLLSVSDSGPGIPEEIRERVFDPFFTTKPAGEGTGLGLAMVYTACREMGGDVDLRCPATGGTTVTLSLPAARPPGPPAATDERSSPHPCTSGWVLVVEDEEQIARALLTALEGAGYRVVRASTGLEALDALRHLGEELGLVVLDLVLPELTGHQVLRVLSGLAPHVPVLVVTGREDLAPEEIPGARLMVKPFTTDEFLDAVARMWIAGGRP